MDKIYACLLGEWVCLNDDPDCKIGGEHLYTLDEWLDGNSEIYAPFKRKNENLFLIRTMYQSYTRANLTAYHLSLFRL